MQRFLSALKRLTIPLCPKCGKSLDPESFTPGESAGWCPRCENAFELPFFCVPGWVAGVIAILVLRMYL